MVSEHPGPQPLLEISHFDFQKKKFLRYNFIEFITQEIGGSWGYNQAEQKDYFNPLSSSGLVFFLELGSSLL